jgi:hypothetical protein
VNRQVEAAVQHSARQVRGEFVSLAGEPFYRISNYDAMDAFFMSIVSASDHYLFISSTGGLTAGRRDPDHALFPYYTDDRIHESAEHTGSKTLFRIRQGEGDVLWEPFSIRHGAGRVCARNLYKSACGNRIVFEEVNDALALAFRYEWATSERFGFVRTARIENLGAAPLSIELLDGLQNLLPCGVSRRFQLEYSTLVDGYKRTELEPSTGLAILQLTSVPVDRAEPSESLRANVAWSVGLEAKSHLLSSLQLDAFRAGEPIGDERDMHGRRGAYFVHAAIELEPHGVRQWKIAADVNRDAAGVRKLLHELRSTERLAGVVDADVAEGTESLRRIAASADGLQLTREPADIWHHFASTVFNVMRGGVPEDGYRIRRADFAHFVGQMNRTVAARHKRALALLPERLEHSVLLAWSRAQNDADLERIAHEYLPLTFSRRHGDPSRPWNIFDIRLKNEQGLAILNYQGNWRDIFQNWEALSFSYPGYTLSMIFKFLDCSTADGYNPYRISREGCDWEVLEPHDSWSFIGYWGDHQVVYLLRLLEQAERTGPDSLHELLGRQLFGYANVPYRIKPYVEQLADPQSTIIFDHALHKKVLARAARLGGDGKLLAFSDGSIVRATLAEKLLLLLLTKFSNFIPGAGIWLNTQRPEWNDANNALVGLGTSVVTVCYLRRCLSFVRALFAGSREQDFSLPAELAQWMESTAAALRRFRPGVAVTPAGRKQLLDELGEAGTRYRQGIYATGMSGERRAVSSASLDALFADALLHVEHTIRSNRREDGLYHAYNLMESSPEAIEVHRLPLMLEGQVAALSSGMLSPGEAAHLLDALRSSALYRADQHSYILYPVKELAPFLEKNNLTGEMVERSQLLKNMLAAGDRRIVVRDVDGGVHFHDSFLNAARLRAALEAIREPGLRRLAREESETICAIYEELFRHRYFNGRSEALYKYEGIGCIYWHMVSKLLVAAQESLSAALLAGADEPLLERLRAHYRGIRAGLGTHKGPREYGAVPMDPYSHTPDFAGAQQPGMTGQVKEDLIAREGEMGVQVREGVLQFDPRLMTGSEFLDAPAGFSGWDVEGRELNLALEAGTLAFTLCGLPVVLHRGGGARLELTLREGGVREFSGCALDVAASRSIFERRGEYERLDVFLP